MNIYLFLAIICLLITPGYSQCAAPCALQPGLRGSYFNDITLGNNLMNPPAYYRYGNIDFNWGWTSGPGAPLTDNYFSIVWEGVLTAPTTGIYDFMSSSDDGHNFFFDGILYSNHFGRGIFPNVTIPPQGLNAGLTYNIRFDYVQMTGNAYAILYWRPPGGDWAPVPASVLSGPVETCPQKHIVVPGNITILSNPGFVTLDISIDGPISAPVSVILSSTCVAFSECIVTFVCGGPTTLSVQVWATDCLKGQINLISNSTDVSWDARTNVIDVTVIREPPAQCRSWGDPHILTFDGLNYDSLLSGVHTLVQTLDGNFVIQTQQQMCVTTTCNLAVVIKYKTTFFQVGFNGAYELIVTYFVNPPENMVAVNFISGRYIFTTSVGIQVTIIATPYHNVSSITVITEVTSIWQNELFGLCGNFNGNPNDDSNSTTDNLVPNDQNLFLNKNVVFPDTSSPSNVSFPTCGRSPREFTPCNPNPCQNGGTCNQFGNTYNCTCPPGFQGINCEQTTQTTNPCQSRPCLNGGTCQQVGNGTTYVCHCPPGWTGVNCEISTCPCDSHPCAFGSTCIVKGDDYICRCPSGCLKKVCEVLDPCASDPCPSGSTCINEGETYICRCPAGSFGRHCEPIPDPCDPNPCNSGTCLSRGFFYTCDCPPGSTGPHCEFIIP